MTTTIPQSNAQFNHEITQHSATLPPLAQTIASSPETALESFYTLSQTISPNIIMNHRNELARAFSAALQKNEWSLENSQKAIPVVNWLLALKRGQVGGYIRVIRPMVDLACRKLTVPLAQRRAWKKVVAERPSYWPNNVGEQAVDAVPHPVVRGPRVFE